MLFFQNTSREIVTCGATNAFAVDASSQLAYAPMNGIKQLVYTLPLKSSLQKAQELYITLRGRIKGTGATVKLH